jgi:SAM-dependent methyltransferase
MPNENQEQSTFWEELAPDWLASLEHTELVSGPFGASAMRQLFLRPGQRVLDIGCGAGSTTLEIARQVGDSGYVLGLDIAPAMIAAATGFASAQGVTNVTFTATDAQVVPFDPASFDAAFSRFGVMFFSDPEAAFANIRTALRPGGVFAFACWENIFANEWMFVPGSAVVSVTGALPPMPGPGEPGPFSLADRDRIESLLVGAGFTDVEITSQAEMIVMRAAEIESLVSLSRRVGPVREALRTADAETATRIESAVRSAILDRAVEDVVSLGATAFIVTAR